MVLHCIIIFVYNTLPTLTFFHILHKALPQGERSRKKGKDKRDKENRKMG